VLIWTTVVSLVDAGEDTEIAVEYLRDRVAVRDHEADHIDAFGEVFGRVGDADARFGERALALGGPVVHGQVEPGVVQVPRHRRAHRSESDESDCCHGARYVRA